MNYEKFEHKNWKDIFLVDMTRELDHNFSEITTKWLNKYIKQNKNIMILVNKKGYSKWIICSKCGYIPQCDHCSISISYHIQENKEKIGLCHICKKQYNIPEVCPQCKNKTLNEYWMGTQKIQEFIKENYKLDAIIIESGKVNSINKINKTREKIKETKGPKIFIGTSLLNYPIKDIKINLIIFLDADLWLNIPDFSAAKNNFHFLYDTFANHACNNYIVQTRNPENYSIRNACRMNKKLFTEEDNKFRQENNYPPFTDICILLYKNEIEEKVFNKVDKLYKELLYLKEKYEMTELEIYTTPPLIYKIFGKYRYNIILKWKNLRNFMDIVYTKLSLNQKWFKIDRKANSIT